MVTVCLTDCYNGNLNKIICKSLVIINACMLIVALQIFMHSCNLNLYFFHIENQLGFNL